MTQIIGHELELTRDCMEIIGDNFDEIIRQLKHNMNQAYWQILWRF